MSLSKKTQDNVRSWMRKNLADHIDECNEVDCTGMAEACCDVLDLYEGEEKDEIPEEIFDIAFQVSETHKSHDD